MQRNNESTNYRKGLRKKILHTSLELFKEKGIKAVKMDDIANRLSISKRTLYEVYDNKEDLLLEGVKQNHEREMREMDEFMKEHNDVLQLILHYYRAKLSDIRNVNPTFFADMSKYEKVSEYFNKNKEENQKSAQEFFLRGVEEGYFMPQLNYSIVLKLGEAALHYVMSEQLYKDFGLKDIFQNFVAVQLRGICTEKGQALLDRALWEE